MLNNLKQRFARLAGTVAVRRDQKALAELFDCFAPPLNSHLQRSGMEPPQVEELTQKVTIVLWRRAALFDPPKSLLAHGCTALPAIAALMRSGVTVPA